MASYYKQNTRSNEQKILHLLLRLDYSGELDKPGSDHVNRVRLDEKSHLSKFPEVIRSQDCKVYLRLYCISQSITLCYRDKAIVAPRTWLRKTYNFLIFFIFF